MAHVTIIGNLLDIPHRRVYAAKLKIENGTISAIEKITDDIEPSLPFITPGFIDAHVHVESSMLVPSEFARLAVVHGTVSTVSDPHEIANVCGMEGVRFMINNGKQVSFKFNFGAPSCVPATTFETAGATIDAHDVETLLKEDDIRYLSEMMNFPGAIHGDPEVMKKIEAAHALGKPVDGHAPGLRGDGLKQYIARGIYTDHECFTLEEAAEKLSLGMKVIIREGSAAKNYSALIPLITEHHDNMMFCSDDKHPDGLAVGHINKLCARAIADGYDLFHVLQAACVNPVKHYKLDVGLLQAGDPADFVVLKDLKAFDVVETYIAGQKVAEHGKTLIPQVEVTSVINQFDIDPISLEMLAVPASGEYTLPVIECLDGQLITPKISLKPKEVDGFYCSDVDQDVLKIVVVNRYTKAPIAKAFIHRFNLKQGAIASSVAHDSHNIVAVGVDDESLCKAINLVIEARGGVSCVGDGQSSVLPLPVAGLMSADDGYQVAEKYTAIDLQAKALGSTLAAPFMSLSFMALLVIPHVKLSDLGLFDGDAFKLY